MENNVDKYTYRIVWSAEDDSHIARCLEFPSLSAHGDTPAKALSEIEFVVNETIKWLLEEGEPVPVPFGMKPFRGHLTLRIPAEKHREIVIRSAEEGVSVNKFILSKL
ncbi:MAG: toxin-antitoxin system HicB family antitoxin [Desulfobacterales bacterium]|jgi:predicted RNase H-like HicB family nuclease|nr:toxin-antitoxin system HicB family antitoxin [Desulfobacterales bacterium]